MQHIIKRKNNSTDIQQSDSQISKLKKNAKNFVQNLHLLTKEQQTEALQNLLSEILALPED